MFFFITCALLTKITNKMKKILPIIAVIFYTMSCAPPKMVNENSTKKNEKKLDVNINQEKRIAPGTCSLIITDCVVLSKDTPLKIKGKVQSIIAYGAGFNSTFSKNEELEILISNTQAQSLKDKKEISCSILKKEGRYETTILELIKVN